MPLEIGRSLGKSWIVVLPDGRDIWVTLIETWRGGARVEIDAPKDIIILREEVMDQYRPREAGGVERNTLPNN